jgi:hypothetical protein
MCRPERGQRLLACGSATIRSPVNFMLLLPRNLCLLWLALLCCSTLANAQNEQPKPKPRAPNIEFLLADDK